METIGTPLMWTVFTVLVLVALAVDLLVLRQNGPHKVSTREAVIWSLAWIALAMVFNAGLWWYLQGQLPAQDADRIALEFLTGYLVEKALAETNGEMEAAGVCPASAASDTAVRGDSPPPCGHSECGLSARNAPTTKPNILRKRES